MSAMFYCDLDPNRRGLVFNSKNFVDNSFIDKVEKYIKTHQLQKAGFMHGEQKIGLKEFDRVRNSQICWMTDEKCKDELMPLYQELIGKIRNVNGQYWNWIIDGWEPLQYTEYDESYNGHYDWHIDYGFKDPENPHSRKLSFSLGLSDKDDYEGGELIGKMSIDDHVVKLDKGEIFLFPSWMLHKVTPVTKGKRKVIVGWGRGPVV